jgi:UDP-2,3-diacylglucosamine pyrophosphatase LpxH
MPALERPCIVVSDAHLGPTSPAGAGRDLARLVAAYGGTEVILAGDIFDLSFAPTTGHSAELLKAILEAHPELCQALGHHVHSGGTLTLIPGNHDAALGDQTLHDLLLSLCELRDTAPLHVAPWFVRRGTLHVEHGHVYDPDNAPAHPLAEWVDQTEPLGVALTRRFVARSGASHFIHAQDSTPVDALAKAFKVYGRRAPGMIAQYFRTAIALCVQGGAGLSQHVEREVSVGQGRAAGFASSVGLSLEQLERMVAGTPAPTHLSRRDLFFRLYFDRVLASLLLLGSVMALPRRPTAPLVAAASLAYLAGSMARGRDRYGALPVVRLREAAERVRELSGAHFVIFGHTHNEDASAGYLNSGSFAFPAATGRPYVHVDAHGATVERRRCAVSA